jgi:hypothetical protein
MEDIVNDYLWFEYEGKIMVDMWNKYIRWKIDYKGQKNLVNKFFRHEDIKEFYKTSMAIFNISNILEEPWAYKEMLIERYKKNKEQCDEHFIDMLNIEYVLWRFEGDLVCFRLFLEILEK